MVWLQAVISALGLNLNSSGVESPFQMTYREMIPKFWLEKLLKLLSLETFSQGGSGQSESLMILTLTEMSVVIWTNRATLDLKLAGLYEAVGWGRLCFYWMYSLLPAAVLNGHNLGALKQHSFIILQFWRSQVQNSSHGDKTQASAKLCSSWRLERRSRFLAFSSLWKMPAFLALGPSSLWPWVHVISCCSDPHPLASLSQGLCDYIGRSHTIQNNCPISRSLIPLHLQSNIFTGSGN